MIRDLDELILECHRNPRSQRYVTEAVAAYRGGAYRSAIIATWIAVVFDFIDKLRELELAGSPRAGQILAEIERARVTNDVDASLRFERNLLATAAKEFKLLSPLQLADLERLQQDRNRCSHPSFQTTDEPYSPSAELARYHLRSAVSYMLSQPPVQGKAAIDRILTDIESEYFPIKRSLAVRHLRDGPMARPNAFLTRNLAICLTKKILRDNEGGGDGQIQRYASALVALHDLQPAEVENALRERLPDIARGLGDDMLIRPLIVVHRLPVAAEMIGEANALRLGRFVEAPPAQLAGQVVQLALSIPMYANLAVASAVNLPDDVLGSLLEDPQAPSELYDEAIRRFAQSNNFREANSRGGWLIQGNVDRLSVEQVDSLLESVHLNDQVRHSNVAPRIVKAILKEDSPITGPIPDRWLQFYRQLMSVSYGVSTDVSNVLESYFPALSDEPEEDQ